MAPQHVFPLCSKPLDLQSMTIEGILVGLESASAIQQGSVANNWVVHLENWLFNIVQRCSSLFRLVTSCSKILVHKPHCSCLFRLVQSKFVSVLCCLPPT